MKKILVTLLFAFASAGHCLELREFAPPKSFWPSSNTVTVEYVQPNAKGVIVFLPGGNGQFPIPKTLPGPGAEPRGFGIVLKTLSDLSGFTVVVVNSPYSLDTPGTPYLYVRESSNHLDRIDAIVRHYQQTHKVWLMGHSNGTFSVTALLNRLQETNEAHLVSGVILSGTRDVTQFKQNPNLPTVFVHHVKDGCQYTTFTDAQRTFVNTEKINSKPTQFVAVDSDASTNGNPCHSGYHMMQGAQVETATEIHKFIKDAQ
jgi:pimeloyl-ACP methyl ester carboxylesterase